MSALAQGYLEGWYGQFFHRTTPMYTCSTCRTGNVRGGNCGACEQGRLVRMREAEKQEFWKAEAKNAEVRLRAKASAGVTHDAVIRGLTSKITYWNRCTCRGSNRYACQYCIDQRDVLD